MQMAKIKSTAGWCPRMGDTGRVDRIYDDPTEQYPIVVRFVGICWTPERGTYDLVLSYKRAEVELL